MAKRKKKARRKTSKRKASKRQPRRTAAHRAATRKLVALNKRRAKQPRSKKKRAVISEMLNRKRARSARVLRMPAGSGPRVHPQGASMLALAGIAGLMGYGMAKTGA